MARIDRSLAARLGTQTVALMDAGGYEGPAGWVDLRSRLDAARDGTCSHPPDAPIPTAKATRTTTRYEVRNETTLQAARRLADAGLDPVALNFASAYHPGGGFRSGSRAQEESLAWSSGLYHCIVGHPMYAYNEANRSPLYSDWLLYSPAVPVFREADGALLAEPYACAFITAPAVNAKAVLGRDPTRRDEIRQVMGRRIDRVLAAAAHHGHTAIVLGAWGCGAFGNAPEDIAAAFRDALGGRHEGRFASVIFAVIEWRDDERTIGPFRRAFEPTT